MKDEAIPQSLTVPRLLTLHAVAEALSLSPHTIRKLAKQGRLHPTKIVRRLLFDAREVERFLAEHQ
jgi:excisionase family DNA binding protein